MSPAKPDDKHWAAGPSRASFDVVTATEGVDLLIGVAVLALVLYRQLQNGRSVTTRDCR